MHCIEESVLFYVLMRAQCKSINLGSIVVCEHYLFDDEKTNMTAVKCDKLRNNV